MPADHRKLTLHYGFLQIVSSLMYSYTVWTHGAWAKNMLLIVVLFELDQQQL